MIKLFPILKTTTAKTVVLVIVVTVYIGVIVIQVPVPRVIGIVLRRRPKVGVVTHIVEITIVVAVAARKGTAL